MVLMADVTGVTQGGTAFFISLGRGLDALVGAGVSGDKKLISLRSLFTQCLK